MARRLSIALGIFMSFILAGCGGSASFKSNLDPSTITSIAVSCSPSSIQIGQSSQCSATVLGAGGSSALVTWTATNGTISPAGLFTPSGSGTATVTATSVQDATKSGTATVLIGSTSAISAVTVTCTPSAILIGQTSACGANVTGTGSFSSAVTWAVSPSAAGSVSGSGVFTPSAAGTATITATSTQDATKSGTAIVTVNAVATITGVTVNCIPSAILATQTSVCTATVTGAGSYSSAVTWSATGGTITAGGVFTPSGAGTAMVTATSVQDTTKFGSAAVPVTSSPVIVSANVSCTPSTILTSQTSACTATVVGTGSYSSAVTWTATGGTITAGGVFVPSGAGTATIRATSVQDATKFGMTSVTVTSSSSTISAVTVSCTPTSIQLTQTSTCAANVSGTGNYSSAVTWTATDGTINSAGVFTPSGSGTATITATSVQDTTKSGSTNVTIASQIQTVFIIMMENQNWNSSAPGTFTSSNAPYIMNTIVPSGATANNYGMVNGGPSEPNYIWLEGGDDFGLTTDNDPSPSNSISSTQHLATYLNNAGISWKAYVENIDGTECPLVSNPSAYYYAKHNPFVFFNDLTNNLNTTSATCISHIRPYGELATDLAKGSVARYNFIVPNIIDDMHDSNIATGDTWLSQNVPAILGSSAYQNNGVLFVMWDESATDKGTLPFFVLSPLVKRAGYSNTIQYNHNSTLWTLQEIFGVGPCLANACGATDLSDLFAPGVL